MYAKWVLHCTYMVNPVGEMCQVTKKISITKHTLNMLLKQNYIRVQVLSSQRGLCSCVSAHSGSHSLMFGYMTIYKHYLGIWEQ